MITSMMDEIPRRELSFEALSGRVIEHVASADGAYYRPFQGDPAFTGDDVTKYYATQDGPSHARAVHRPVQPARARANPGTQGAVACRAGSRGEGPLEGTSQGAAVTKWLYQARVVPMGKPMLIDDNHGRPTTFTFDEVTSLSHGGTLARATSRFARPRPET